MARDQRLDLLVGGAAREQLLDPEREHPDSDRRRLGVDEPDPVAFVGGRDRRTLEVPERRAEMWSE